MRPDPTRLLKRELWMHAGRSLVASAVVIGMVAGLAAAGLLAMIEGLSAFLYGEGGRQWWMILIPAAGGLLIGPIVSKVAPETKGHGVPEVMLAVARHRGFIRGRVALLKALTASITIGTGGSAGREGPIVQVGSAVGSAIGRVLGQPPAMIRMFVACGAAAGIAASFNTPIAGVIFALEIILRDFTGRAFAMVVISAVTASVVSHALSGAEVFFEVPVYSMVSIWELVPYLVLGAVGAVVARLFVVVLYGVEDAFERFPVPESIKPALGGLALGLLAWWFPTILGGGHDSIEAALHGSLPLATMAVLAGMKILATSFTLGAGGSGGVFAPSLFVGSMFGGALGIVVQTLAPEAGVQPGAYALVGMGVVFTGATGAALSGILFLFELTRDYDLILPMMASCVIAAIVGRALGKDTIYTRKLLRRGIDLEDRDPEGMRDIAVREAMTSKVDTVRLDSRLSEIVSLVHLDHHSAFPVVGEDDIVKGIITGRELMDVLSVRDSQPNLIIAQDVMRPFEPSVVPGTSLAEAVELMKRAGVRRIPVVSEDGEGKLVGILTNHDVVTTLARVKKENRE